MEYKEFTKPELEKMFSIVKEFGGANKVKLMRNIKSLIRYDRKKINFKIKAELDKIINYEL